MEIWQLYAQLGFEHIAAWNGYDHILFLIVLCVGYEPKEWKKILFLITAFTIGHSLTLILATLKIITLPSNIVEFAITSTILISAILNLFPSKHSKSNYYTPKYFIAGSFGLIHGLGFAGGLQSLLGKEQSIVLPLFSFNLGLEIGQIVVMGAFLTIHYLVIERLKVKPLLWNKIISLIAIVVSIHLIMSTYLTILARFVFS